MALNPKQWRHTECVAQLILHMIKRGFRPRLAYALRSVEAATSLGKADSLHTKYLAVDIDLFDASGNYLSSTEDHRQFGKFWESLDRDARWGGDFNDGNHYSFQHEGNR